MRRVSRGPTTRERRLVTNIATQVPVSDEVFNWTLQVTTFLHVVAIFPMETTIPSFVVSFGACLHWIGSLQKPPLPNLKEDLCSSRVKGYWRRSGWQHVRPVFPPLWWSRGVSSGQFRSEAPTSVSTIMYWCSRYSISGTVTGDRSINDQKNLDGLSPIKNAWMAREGWTSRTPQTCEVNRPTN
ncbi:hypothetical protein BHM03_00059377 [Ensete ventricosum]|nr:hypothetical protein BHM03_00059377 [Ensete ventricosum]